jgi:signal transduction histidine kinase
MGNRVWPALVLLALVVLAPTAVLTWLVGRAADNERLATRQRLRQAHEAALRRCAREVSGHFQSAARRADALAAEYSGGRLFGQVVEQGLADSAVCLDPRGDLAYPQASVAVGVDLLEGVQAWSDAQELESRGRHAQAAKMYEQIAEAGLHPAVIARAQIARARCLGNAGEARRAIEILQAVVQAPGAQALRDRFGRLLAVDAGLYALMLSEESGAGSQQAESMAAKLLAWGADYARVSMPASQRRFLGRQLARQFPDRPKPKWLEAEDLAAEFAERLAHQSAATWEQQRLRDGRRAWRLVTPRKRAVLLFHEASIQAASLAHLQSIDEEAQRFELLAPGASNRQAEAIEVDGMNGWRLALVASPQGADTSADRRIAAYGWATALTIGAILAAAVLVGGMIGRQQRASRLQNDWLATVSHELKTPLASIRLLTESLQDNEKVDSREYLRLIGQETARLSRLIDGLLAFSRVEHSKLALDLQPARPEEIADRAAQLLSDRLAQPGCRFESRIQPALPEVRVDRDALIAVLVNLLDNAWKFTRGEKEIVLRVERAVDRGVERVCFRVSDNGIGLSAQDARKVFRRFFQVDQRLSRDHGGCGLGLALARLVARAHGGDVTVESEPGRGSTFSVLIPVHAG